MFKKLALIAFASALGVLHLPAEASAEKKALVVGAGYADAGRLDPHLSAAGQDKGLMSWMFNGLVRIEPGKASPEHIEADLAESWTSNDEGTDWVFKLRQGVQCHHDYGELTADDVVYSLKRAADPGRSSFSADFAAFENIEAVDKYTVRVSLKHAIPSVLGTLTSYHGGNIVCKKAAEELGEDFQKRPIGTGPFMFEEYRPQQFVKLVANKDYFRGAPQLEEITYRYLPSDASRDLAFRSGEVDMIFGKQDEIWVKRTKGVKGAVVAVMEPAELSTLHLNTSSAPLDDIRVRQAIAHAIDRQALVALKGHTSNREAKSVVPIGNLGFSDQAALLPYDPDKARELLAQAGHADGVTIKAIQTTLPALLTIMEPVQEQLRKVGIRLELEPVDHATWHSQIRKDLSQAVLYQAARFPVADVYLTQFYHSNSTVGTETGVTNFSHCGAADGEIERARVEPDRDRQVELWREAQVKILESVCSVPMFESLVLWAYKDNLDLGFELEGSLSLIPPITEKTRFVN